MFIVLKQAGYFARTHAQPLLLIALLLSLPGWIIEYALPDRAPIADTEVDTQGLLTSLVMTLVAVVQYAAAMLYIHQQVLLRPISALQAISIGASRIGPLLIINALMALAIALGLALLIAPGLYMAYKLMFGEFYLLFHGQRPLQALRSSYKDNTDLADKLLPPLLFWGGLIATSAIGQQLLLGQWEDPLVINLVFEAITLALTLWGWALMYRLYQLYIEPLGPASPIAEASSGPESQPEHEQEPKTIQKLDVDKVLPAEDPEPQPPHSASHPESKQPPTKD